MILEFWGPLKVAAVVILVLAALLAAPQKAAAQHSNYPVVGSIADDLIALGDLQFGPTPFIFQKEATYTTKVRHQRVQLEGGELFCSQFPQHVQRTNLFGIRVSQYYDQFSSTLCHIVSETSAEDDPLDASDRAPAQVLQFPVDESAEDWLQGSQLVTERSYCLGSYDSREFTTPPTEGTWIRQGETTTYSPDMFVGFTVLKDQERGLVLALSDVLEREQAREVGCSAHSKILVKLSVMDGEL